MADDNQALASVSAAVDGSARPQDTPAGGPPAGCHRVVNRRDGRTFDVKRKDLLLMSAIQQEIDYPHSCRVGSCGTCKTKLLSGKIRPLVDFALSPLTNEELADGYVLACQSMVNSDLEIDVRLGESITIPHRHVAGRISHWRRLPGQVIDLRIKLDEPMPFMAGQYCQLAESGSYTRRAFSFYDAAPAPDSPGIDEVGFLVKYIPGGRFSGWLNAANRVGTKMWLQGPQGRMGVEDIERDGLCVAAGTGLAPIRSIVADRLARSTDARFTIVFGVRGSEDLFAREMLSDLMAAAPDRVELIEIVSHEPEASDWPGRRGLVTDALQPDMGIDFANVVGYVCGNLPMVEASERRLMELGVDPERIHADKFEPTGIGV